MRVDERPETNWSKKMNQDEIIEQAIKELTAIRDEHIDRLDNYDEVQWVPDCWCHKVKNIITLLKSAKAEQPPGEFTKNLRPRIDKLQFNEAEVHEACDRLDALEKRNRELETLYGIQSKITHEAADDSERLRGRLDAQQQEIAELKAENTKLKEIVENAGFWGRSCARLVKKNKALTERNKKLKSYSRHTTGCGWFVEGGLCTCGLEQTLKENTR